MTEVGFQALAHPALGQRGVAGRRIEVRFAEGSLRVQGEESTSFELPAMRVDRLRLGCSNSRWGTWYIAHVFLDGSPEPLILRTTEPGAPGYADTMRRFIQAIARVHGVGRVELGLSRSVALTARAGTLFVISVCLLIASAFWSTSPAVAFAFIVAGCVVVAGVVIGSRIFNNNAPRAIRQISEVERFLPKP